MDRRVGEPNEEGADIRSAAIACSVVGATGLVVGEYQVWISLLFLLGGLGAWVVSAFEHRRRGLTPLEAWARRPGRFTDRPPPSWVLVVVAALGAVGFAVGAALHAYWAVLCALPVVTATQYLAWQVVAGRHEGPDIAHPHPTST